MEAEKRKIGTILFLCMREGGRGKGKEGFNF